jgi:hypothetical protein
MVFVEVSIGDKFGGIFELGKVSCGVEVLRENIGFG